MGPSNDSRRRTAFADALRAKMSDRSITKVAREAGLNRQQLHRYLQGEAMPKADAFMRLCAALESSPYDLIPEKHKTTLQEDLIDIQTLRGLQAFQTPSNDELPDGNYQLYHLSFLNIGKVAIVAMKITSAMGYKTFHIRTPNRMLATFSDRGTREIKGVVFSEYNSNLQFIGLWQFQNKRRTSLHIFFAGPEKTNHEFRSGVYPLTDRMPLNINPAVSALVLVPRQETPFRSLYRESRMVDINDLPHMYREVFIGDGKSTNQLLL